jgi:probable F420-dependent oxidoreductase
MKVTRGLLPHKTIADAPEFARQTEAMGYDGIWVPETKHNPFTTLALLAEHSERLRVGPGVTIAFARSPYVMANHGWDLQEFSGGRFVIGLGTQVKGHNERRFSVPWGPPNPRLREYVEMMRACWHTWRTGEKPSYEGKYYRYTLDAWNWNPGPIDVPDPKIALAAVRPLNTRLAAEVGDGVLWHPLMSWAYRDQVLVPELEEGARRAGKDPKDLVISGGGFVVTAKNEEQLETALAEQRRRMAFYGSTRTYHDALRMAGLEDEAMLLHRLSIEQKWAEMAKVVDDDFVEKFAIVGTWDEIAGKMRDVYGGLNTEIRFNAEVEDPDDEAHIKEVVAEIQAIPAYGEMERAPAAV